MLFTCKNSCDSGAFWLKCSFSNVSVSAHKLDTQKGKPYIEVNQKVSETCKIFDVLSQGGLYLFVTVL